MPQQRQTHWQCAIGILVRPETQGLRAINAAIVAGLNERSDQLTLSTK